jgi:opacity protein-like surface antigen
VAYGKSFTERLGGFVRAGYQISEVDLTLNGAETYDAPFDQFDYDATGVATVDGKATVLGAGLFYALGENMSVTLYYDLKSFSYDDYQFAFDDGYEPQGQSRFDEDQSTVGLTLRYSF